MWTTLAQYFWQKKIRKKNTVVPRDGHVAHVCKASGSITNGVDIWTFVRENEENTLFPSNNLVLVSNKVFSLDSAPC